MSRFPLSYFNVYFSKATEEPFFSNFDLIIPEAHKEEFQAIQSKTGLVKYFQKYIKPDENGEQRLLIIVSPPKNLLGRYRDFREEFQCLEKNQL